MSALRRKIENLGRCRYSQRVLVRQPLWLFKSCVADWKKSVLLELYLGFLRQFREDNYQKITSCFAKNLSASESERTICDYVKYNSPLETLWVKDQFTAQMKLCKFFFFRRSRNWTRSSCLTCKILSLLVESTGFPLVHY